jgi:hypothetical protein
LIGTGLQMAPTSGTTPSAEIQPGAARRPEKTNMNVGGAMSAQSVGSVQAELAASREQAEEEQNAPAIADLAGHVKSFWLLAREAKRDVELTMIEALYARRGEYPAQKASEILQSGQPLIYMMLAASKMRQAESLLRDVLIGAGTEKPWTLEPTPVPELPPLLTAQIRAAFVSAADASIQMGYVPNINEIRDLMNAVKQMAVEALREEAQASCDRMELKMEDQLIEGGFNDALDGFISDLTTFKTAFLAGPIVRRKPSLTWVQGNPVPVVQTVETMEWERVDPFMMYPAPWARTINEGPLIRRHRLTRESLTEMIGIEGFAEHSIRRVLDLYGTGGLNDWLSIDSEVARAEGKNSDAHTMSQSGLIDALQYWGSVSGKMLREWGMTPKQVPDESKEYQVECWLIGPYVIKSVLNTDPLARRPFYANSYERIPGSVWGNSVYDLMADCQAMCNAAARSLAANLGIASGPQVVVNVSRLPTGESVTNMYPWKVWQVEEDPMGNTQAPITFFQPSSNAAELMGVYEKFSVLADEYTGIPRYMTGSESTPGAGRTASGLSMMMGNASKIIKQVVSGIDQHVLQPLLERLYFTNMRYSNDPDLKGDVKCRARGAMSLTTKEAAQVRRNEFLAASNNPVDLQIMGLTGRAELLRAAASQLDLNPSKIVLPTAVIKQKEAEQAAMQQQAQMQGPGAPGEGQGPGAPSAPAPAQGGPGGPGPSPNGQVLMDGAPQTDTFSPTKAQ